MLAFNSLLSVDGFIVMCVVKQKNVQVKKKERKKNKSI